MDPDDNDLGEKERVIQDDHFSEEEVEFVSEGPSRPVLECIDLVSDDELQILYQNRKAKDHHMDRVTATLDRLARHVEVQKRKQREKSKAFQDKLNSQRAHGLQELELNKDRPGTSAAKICVNQWLNMPGLKPGYVSSSRRTFSQRKEIGPINTGPITCPVMYCNRTFDNQHLLLGHLKRFDHSPCDPTISLHGTCDSSYVCLVCQHRFATTREFTAHLTAKIKLADGSHHQSISPLVIHCYACPCCFLLFNQRDECLKHMSSNNHFVRSFKLGDGSGVPCPIPIPSYAKRVLIALCKDIPFQVVCTSCRCELRSHMEVTAHFRTICRNAGPASLSEKSIAEVASVFQLKAFCQTCKQGLRDETHIAKHITRTSHNVKQNTSIEESILAFCYINEGIRTPSDFCLSATNARLKHCTLKRSLNHTNGSSNLSKHIKESGTDDCIKKEGSIMVTAWFCECSQQFSTEKAAEKHIMTANRISYKCMVCAKLADDPAIIRLHMCRIHGGARLDSFLFWCQICKAELARLENVLVHIIDCHGGHSFYYDQEVLEEQYTTSKIEMISEIQERDTSPSPQQSDEGSWQCHICEEMFDTEETVLKHCKSINIHQFHKYCCDTCKKTFHKMDTLLRHCQLQHNGDIQVKYFCGLCNDLYLDEEAAFLDHFESFHSLDYSYVPNRGQPNIKISDVASTTCSELEKQLTCGCLAKYSLKERKKEDYRLCLDRLFRKGKLWYSCSSCPATNQTIEGINTHLCKKGPSSNNIFAVKCSICSKSFADPEGAQCHYHMKHSFLKETSNNYNVGTDESKSNVFTFTAIGRSVNEPPAKPMLTDANPLNYEAQSSTPNHLVETYAPQLAKIEPETEAMGIQTTDPELQNSELPDLDFLRTMTHIVFVDLGNWNQFFSLLPGFLNQGTFVWGFHGGKSAWKPPVGCKCFNHLSNTGCFFLHPHCCDPKDSTSIAICTHAGRLDEQLPKQITFIVLSDDKGFIELEDQFKQNARPFHILNPHHMGDEMFALLNSISDTTQDASDEDMEINSTEQDEESDLKEAIRRSLLEM
ncbi:E3 SUMO-protein ligase ZNF451 [Mantella aurantiaca]